MQRSIEEFLRRVSLARRTRGDAAPRAFALRVVRVSRADAAERAVPVHDLGVPGRETFVAGGVVVHNCGVFDNVTTKRAFVRNVMTSDRHAIAGRPRAITSHECEVIFGGQIRLLQFLQ